MAIWHHCEVFQSVDELSMGLPLAPLLANWFVCKLETDLLRKDELNMCSRCVDNFFTLFSNDKIANEFNEKLNNFHEGLIITLESNTSNYF